MSDFRNMKFIAETGQGVAYSVSLSPFQSNAVARGRTPGPGGFLGQQQQPMPTTRSTFTESNSNMANINRNMIPDSAYHTANAGGMNEITRTTAVTTTPARNAEFSSDLFPSSVEGNRSGPGSGNNTLQGSSNRMGFFEQSLNSGLSQCQHSHISSSGGGGGSILNIPSPPGSGYGVQHFGNQNQQNANNGAGSNLLSPSRHPQNNSGLNRSGTGTIQGSSSNGLGFFEQSLNNSGLSQCRHSHISSSAGGGVSNLSIPSPPGSASSVQHFGNQNQKQNANNGAGSHLLSPSRHPQNNSDQAPSSLSSSSSFGLGNLMDSKQHASFTPIPSQGEDSLSSFGLRQMMASPADSMSTSSSSSSSSQKSQNAFSSSTFSNSSSFGLGNLMDSKQHASFTPIQSQGEASSSSLGLRQMMVSPAGSTLSTSSSFRSSSGSLSSQQSQNSFSSSKSWGLTDPSKSPSSAVFSSSSVADQSMEVDDRNPFSPRRRNNEHYNLRPIRFANGVEVIHRYDGTRLVDENGNPVIDENGNSVLNDYGRYKHYPIGNFVVDRYGRRIL